MTHLQRKKQARDIVSSLQGQIYMSRGKVGEVFVITESSPGAATTWAT